jgi:glycosyltransferase involved in cell wall biosynthesis
MGQAAIDAELGTIATSVESSRIEMRVLFLSGWYPFPPDNGSRIRIFNLIKQLSKEHDITLLSFSRDGQVIEDRLKVMRQYCSTVRAVPLAPFKPGSFRSILGLFSSRPRSFVDTYSREMQGLVEQIRREGDFSVVIASEMDTAPYAATLEGLPRIFEEVELATLREQHTSQSRIGRRLRYGLTWWKTRRFTAHLLRQFDGCTVVSQQERTNVLSIAPNCQRVVVVPNGVDLDRYKDDFGAPEPGTLVFPGALTYDANLDAMEFFLHKVFPLVKVRHPEAILRITGKTNGVPMDRLPLDESVILTGYLDDVRPAIAQSWACVVPLRVGGGTRLKILEAMALGTPVVSTSKGAEGLEATYGEDILVADTPAEFADAVLRLLYDRALRVRLATNGRRLVESRYGWEGISQKLDQLLHDVVREREAK